MLTKESFAELLRAMMEHDHRPTYITVNPIIHAELVYQAASRVVREWPGATRWVGPDGRTWIERHWRTADVATGNGNKARRRMGEGPVNSWFL